MMFTLPVWQIWMIVHLHYLASYTGAAPNADPHCAATDHFVSPLHKDFGQADYRDGDDLV